VIVRIATEGQYEIDGDELINQLNELDTAAVSACERGSEDEFRASYARLLEFIRSHGQPVAEDVLAGSDMILPPPDVTLEEARAEFTGEGLLPG
jgi:effector-binding domain-containing protein